MNILYSFKLKKFVVVDVLCIAFGFILRILAGYSVGNINIDWIMVLLTGSLSLFFSFTKRKLEIKLSIYRISVLNMNIGFINRVLIILAVISTVLYYLIIYGMGHLYTVIPFLLMLFRIFVLADLLQKADPIVVFKDRILICIIVLYVLTFLL